MDIPKLAGVSASCQDPKCKLVAHTDILKEWDAIAVERVVEREVSAQGRLSSHQLDWQGCCSRPHNCVQYFISSISTPFAGGTLGLFLLEVGSLPISH